jgi:transcriptional regulator with XRE-family HTH domain
MPRPTRQPSHAEEPPPPAGIEVGELGQLIRKRRAEENLSVRQAASAANVSFSTLSRVEAGAQPDLTTFLQLCGWLGVDPSRFLRPSPRRHGSALDEVTRHLATDPNLSPEAADRIVTVVQEMYRAFASSTHTHSEQVPLTLHLRAASIMRPGVPERLASVLEDMRSALGAGASRRTRR